MRRREFLFQGGAAAAWPFAARAQQTSKLPRIGMLWANSAEAEKRIGLVPILHARLAELGYVDGKTIIVEERFADGNRRRGEELAAELVRLKPDLIVTGGDMTPVVAGATKVIPIVTTSMIDPVAEGLAVSLAHPGGYVTGNTVLLPEIMAKRLEYLKQLAPSLNRAGFMTVRGLPPIIFEAISKTAKALDVELKLFELADPPAFEDMFAAAASGEVGGLVVFDSAFFVDGYGRIASLAIKYRMASAAAPFYVRSGGLFGYSASFADYFRSAATFVDRILKGAKPGDIPFEQPARFQMSVNLKTAAALGLDAPPTILAAADEVIE